MKITSIKQQVKNENRVSVFVDGEYSFSLTLDQLLDSKIKKNQLLSEAELKKFKKLSEEGKLRARTLEWLMRRPREYLYRKKIDKDLIDSLVGEFQKKNYLNDEQFTRWFAENRLRKGKSERALVSELLKKGISPATIQSIVAELSNHYSEQETLNSLVNKLRKKPRYTDETKLIRYLLSKGFFYGDIKHTLRDQ